VEDGSQTGGVPTGVGLGTCIQLRDEGKNLLHG